MLARARLGSSRLEHCDSALQPNCPVCNEFNVARAWVPITDVTETARLIQLSLHRLAACTEDATAPMCQETTLRSAPQQKQAVIGDKGIWEPILPNRHAAEMTSRSVASSCSAPLRAPRVGSIGVGRSSGAEQSNASQRRTVKAASHRAPFHVSGSNSEVLWSRPRSQRGPSGHSRSSLCRRVDTLTSRRLVPIVEEWSACRHSRLPASDTGAQATETPITFSLPRANRSPCCRTLTRCDDQH